MFFLGPQQLLSLEALVSQSIMGFESFVCRVDIKSKTERVNKWVLSMVSELDLNRKEESEKTMESTAQRRIVSNRARDEQQDCRSRLQNTDYQRAFKSVTHEK